MSEDTPKYDPPVAIEAIARTCHEVNRAFCQYLGDDSQKPWLDTPADIKESAIDGVLFTLRCPDAGDDANHRNWLAFKEAQGWVYGPEKDAEAKTHPCMVPFDQLPKDQQFKDVLFRTVVLSLAEIV